MAKEGLVGKDFDPVTEDALDPEKHGANPLDNPGICPSFSKVKNTPGEDATNDVAGLRMDKKQPYKHSGGASSAAGYTD